MPLSFLKGSISMTQGLKHLDPLVDATARNLKDIQMPQFPPKHRFPFPAYGILQGCHKGSGHQLELAVLFEIPALVHLGHEDLQVDTMIRCS